MGKFRLKGVTLIELMAALALSVLLVTAASGVIKSMMQKKKVFADPLAVQPWRLELAEHLRNDLCQSGEMRMSGRTLELSGFCGHNAETGEAVQIPVSVTWQLKERNGQHVLTRTERPRGGMEEFSVQSRTELAAIGIVGLSVGTFAGRGYEGKTEVQTLTLEERDEEAAGDWTTIPPVVKLIVLGTNKEILIDELIFR